MTDWLRTDAAADLLDCTPGNLSQYSWMDDIGARLRVGVDGRIPSQHRHGGYFFAWREDVILKAVEIRRNGPRRKGRYQLMGVDRAIIQACKALGVDQVDLSAPAYPAKGPCERKPNEA